MSEPLRAYLTGRDTDDQPAQLCACGRALWAVLADPDPYTSLLVTLCTRCDLRSAEAVSPDATPATGMIRWVKPQRRNR